MNNLLLQVETHLDLGSSRLGRGRWVVRLGVEVSTCWAPAWVEVEVALVVMALVQVALEVMEGMMVVMIHPRGIMVVREGVGKRRGRSDHP